MQRPRFLAPLNAITGEVKTGTVIHNDILTDFKFDRSAYDYRGALLAHEPAQTIQKRFAGVSHQLPPQADWADVRQACASEVTSGGSSLDPALRRYYEDRLGYRLDHVRIHHGAAAERLSESVDAYAFTYANHVWLGRSELPRPSYCLAHELVHVIQQSMPPRITRPRASMAS